jgi:hypothetical protein
VLSLKSLLMRISESEVWVVSRVTAQQKAGSKEEKQCQEGKCGQK